MGAAPGIPPGAKKIVSRPQPVLRVLEWEQAKNGKNREKLQREC